MGGAHEGVKYLVEIFLSYLFFFLVLQLTYRSEETSGVPAMVLKTRVLVNFSAFRAFYALKFRGLGFLPRKPSKNDPLMGVPSLNKNIEYLENG